MTPQDFLNTTPKTREEMAECIRQMAQMKVEPYKLELPYDIQQRKERKVSDMIISGAYKENVDLYEAMNRFLDWLLEIFDTKHIENKDFAQNLNKKSEDNPDWFEALCRWNFDVRQGRTLDFFGEVYEQEFKSDSKASRFGQFFTPMDISNLCAEITVAKGSNPDTITVYDCACGSGRMLLGGYTAFREEIDNDTKFHFFFGGDIDHSSVKMCALNLMIHGLQGIVVNQDALRLNKPQYGYLINPTNAPVRTGILSVQYLDSDACANYVNWQVEKNKQWEVHSNTNKTMELYRWQWDVAHEERVRLFGELQGTTKVEPKTETAPQQLSEPKDNASVEPTPLTEPTKAYPKEDKPKAMPEIRVKQPVQLTLFD